MYKINILDQESLTSDYYTDENHKVFYYDSLSSKKIYFSSIANELNEIFLDNYSTFNTLLNTLKSYSAPSSITCGSDPTFY